MDEKYYQVNKLIKLNKKILIISHKDPDPDTIGSAIALKIWLEKEYKKVTLACIDHINEKFNFLPFIDCYVNEFNLNDYDLLIFVDVGAHYMTNFHLKHNDLFSFKRPIINIDHHFSNDDFGTLNIVDPNAASATIILYRIFEFLGVEIDQDMATCLISGIYYDTGSFRHSNTSEEVLAISSVLLKKGARVAELSKSLFYSKSISTLRIWGKALENAHITRNDVVLSIIGKQDYRDTDSSPDKLSGIVDYLNMVPNTKFAALIKDDCKGNIMGSFRTKMDDVDLVEVVSTFGGGGHAKASGFSVPGEIIEERCYRIVTKDMSKKSLDF